jgi:hypothetical protein
MAGLAQGTGNAIASSRGPTARPIALDIRNFLDSGFTMEQIVDTNANCRGASWLG